MYTIDLNFNHANHRDNYRYICSTHIFALKRTQQYTIDLNLNMSIIVIPIYRYVAQIFVCKRTTCTIDLNLNHAYDRDRIR